MIMQANQELQRAYLLLDYGEWDRAMAACERAGVLAPDHWLPETLKGAILAAKGDLQLATRVLKRAADRHPNRAYPRLQLAESLLLSGSLIQGRRHLKKAGEAEDIGEFESLFALLNNVFIDEGSS